MWIPCLLSLHLCVSATLYGFASLSFSVSLSVSLSLSLSLSLFLSLYLSISLSLPLSVPFCLSLSTSLSTSLYLSLPLSLSASLTIFRPLAPRSPSLILSLALSYPLLPQPIFYYQPYTSLYTLSTLSTNLFHPSHILLSHPLPPTTMLYHALPPSPRSPPPPSPLHRLLQHGMDAQLRRGVGGRPRCPDGRLSRPAVPTPHLGRGGAGGGSGRGGETGGVPPGQSAERCGGGGAGTG